MLGFPAVTQAFFIVCGSCKDDPFCEYQGDFMQANYDSLKLAQKKQEEAALKAEEAAEVKKEEKVKLTAKMSSQKEMRVKRSVSPLPKSGIIDLTVDYDSSAGSMTEGETATNGSGIATPKVAYDGYPIPTRGGTKRKPEALLDVGRRASKARFSY
ncbi:hypothetical protein LTS18_012509 [Coniosporium uncinatum]|uniref:Uncharacterized protein n=1 Tax=Coniosporium uncinatum TaxID=93489 RepID=A0ACC3DJA9_9PEZI|nr:hypothetical protein LTS18_012509 [Coniosporium uncinatum]